MHLIQGNYKFGEAIGPTMSYKLNWQVALCACRSAILMNKPKNVPAYFLRLIGVAKGLVIITFCILCRTSGLGSYTMC